MDVISIDEALPRYRVRVGLGVERVGIVVVGVNLIRRGCGGGGGLGGIRVLVVVEEGKVVVTRGHERRQADGNGEEQTAVKRRRLEMAPLRIM